MITLVYQGKLRLILYNGDKEEFVQDTGEPMIKVSGKI